MNQLQNDFDHNTLEAMMERYRAELLRYQRATPPGKPTLEQNLHTVSAYADISEEAAPESDPGTDGGQSPTDLSLDCRPAAADLPPDGDIWQQPSVPVMESEPEPPQIFREDMPPVISPQPETPAFCCHTEFEKCIGGFGSFRPYERLGNISSAPFCRYPASRPM